MCISVSKNQLHGSRFSTNDRVTRKLGGNRRCRNPGRDHETKHPLVFFVCFHIFPHFFGRIHASQVLGPPHSCITKHGECLRSLDGGRFCRLEKGCPPSGLGNCWDGPSSPPHPRLLPRPCQQEERTSAVGTGPPQLLLGDQAFWNAAPSTPLPSFASAAKSFHALRLTPMTLLSPSSTHFRDQPSAGQASRAAMSLNWKPASLGISLVLSSLVRLTTTLSLQTASLGPET